jgi:uncharacterized protein (TIGR02996 family)
VSDADRLSWAILAAPADDAPRLVFADWVAVLVESHHAESGQIIKFSQAHGRIK